MTTPSERPRQKIKEYLLEASLSRKKHVVVEGPTDLHFFATWSQEIANPVTVVEVGSIHVDDELIISHGLAVGNRSRVICLAVAAAEQKSDIRCVADRDCGHHADEFNIETLAWTDYPALESYALSVEILDIANQLGLSRKLPEADEYYEELCFALGEIFAVRKMHPHLPRPNYSLGLKKGATSLNDFEVTKFVDGPDRAKIKDYPRSQDPDPRTYAYGHDLAALLMLKFGNKIKNQAGIQKVEALEGILRLAILAARTYRQEFLFTELESWATN